MGALKRWLMARLVALLEGSWTSGAESCDYLRRLSAVPSLAHASGSPALGTRSSRAARGPDRPRPQRRDAHRAGRALGARDPGDLEGVDLSAGFARCWYLTFSADRDHGDGIDQFHLLRADRLF